MMSVKPWNPYIDVKDSKGRSTELAKLGSYLRYLVEKAGYVSKKLNAEVALQEKRSAYIRKELQIFENKEKVRLEDKTWGWSPLFRILTREVVKGLPERPWEHTADELERIMSVLQKESGTESTTLELECPHIIRALKLYTRLSSGRSCPLAHPLNGMTRDKLLCIAKQETESQRLSSCVQDIVDIGWSLFPCIKVGFCEPLSRCSNDMVALMAYEGWNQEAVLQKIEGFLSRVARRAVLDMHRTKGYGDELAAMWWSSGPADPTALRQHCDEVRHPP